MPSDTLDAMLAEAKKSASDHLNTHQSDLAVTSSFVMIRGAKVRNSMSPEFISDLENDKHIPGFLNFLDN